jgi:hypothetical protein
MRDSIIQSLLVFIKTVISIHKQIIVSVEEMKCSVIKYLLFL